MINVLSGKCNESIPDPVKTYPFELDQVYLTEIIKTSKTLTKEYEIAKYKKNQIKCIITPDFIPGDSIMIPRLKFKYPSNNRVLDSSEISFKLPNWIPRAIGILLRFKNSNCKGDKNSTNIRLKLIFYSIKTYLSIVIYPIYSRI